MACCLLESSYLAYQSLTLSVRCGQDVPRSRSACGAGNWCCFRDPPHFPAIHYRCLVREADEARDAAMVMDCIDACSPVSSSVLSLSLCLLVYVSYLRSRSLYARPSGEVLIYTALSMLTNTPWGYFGSVSFVLLGAIPNLGKKDK